MKYLIFSVIFAFPVLSYDKHDVLLKEEVSKIVKVDNCRKPAGTKCGECEVKLDSGESGKLCGPIFKGDLIYRRVLPKKN